MNEGELMREFTARAKACLLTVDCLGSGNTESEICIISEAPGDIEKTMKMPMVGGSGRLLWDHLRPLSITRKDCYTTNVCKRAVQLGKDADSKSPVKHTEIEHWEGLLDWELDQLPNLKYVLCLGSFALRALTGERGITKWRGSVFDCQVGRERRTVKVICTNNPAHIMRNLAMEPMYKFDLAKLRKVIDGKFRKHTITATINPTVEQALGYLEELERSDKPIAFDIETMGNETACIGFANNAYTGICINFRSARTNRYTVVEERILRDRIQRLFRNNKNRFIAQKASFDCGWLWYKDRIHAPNIWMDTLLAHHTLYPRMPHNLGYLTAQYTDHPYYKDEKDAWREGGNIDEFWEYNVKDCCITWAVHERLVVELKQQRLFDFHFNHVQRLQPWLIDMQVGGLLIDKELKNRIAEDIKNDLDKDLITFHKMTQELTGDPELLINPNSPTQLKKLFFDNLKLVGRGQTTGKQNRQRLRDHQNTSEAARAMLLHLDKYKVEHKFWSTYATSTDDPDGRFRCEYNQFGVQQAPGRLSSSGTLWNSGGNLQNQPHRAYPMFICDEGYELSYFDLKQAEAKVVAWLWNVAALKENFIHAEKEDGFDIHRGNAARIFQVDYLDIPANDWDENNMPTKRYLGKRCVHGLNYRMQAHKLAEVCEIPIQQASEAFASYHRAFPEIQEGWRNTIKDVREEKMLFSPLGRRLIWLERLTEDSYDSVIAFKPQSTIGDKVSGVIYQCMEDPEWPTGEARFWLNLHDALIAIHKPQHGKLVRNIMKKHAESPIPIRGEQVKIFTDLKKSVPDENGIHRWSTLESTDDY
jgi:uracil-DNA glycosylase family 4